MESNNKPEDVDVPWQRVQPISLLFVVLSKLRQWIIPVVVGLFTVREGNVYIIGIGILAFGILMTSAVTHFITLRFRLAGGELQVRDGIFFKSLRTVPANRIQNIDLVQNLLHRIFGVAEVRIETASGKEPEAVLRVLSLVEIERLRASVFARTHSARVDGDFSVTDSVASVNELVAAGVGAVPQLVGAPSQQLLLAISLKQLALAGLASNRGFLLVPIVLGTLYEGRGVARSFLSWFNLKTEDFAIERFSSDLSTVAIVVWLIAGLAVSIVVLKLFSFAWFVIRFYAYQLWAMGDDLRIGCGLLTKVSATIPRSRIQFISIHRTWLGRQLGLAAIRIETAGGGGSEHENASQSVGRRWFVPVISESQVPGLIEQLRPGIQWRESEFEWQPLSPLAGKRLQRFGVVATVVLTLVAGFIWQPWGALIGVVLLPSFIWLGRRHASAMRFARCGEMIIFRSGLMTRKCSCAFIDKVQTLRLSESPFDRRWRMATLSVDTAAAGPAEHRIQVKYLEANVARREFIKLKSAVGNFA